MQRWYVYLNMLNGLYWYNRDHDLHRKIRFIKLLYAVRVRLRED